MCKGAQAGGEISSSRVAGRSPSDASVSKNAFWLEVSLFSCR